MSNDKLAEALRRTCRKMKTFSRTGALDGAVAVWVDEIESAIAAHSAQAHPPVASVPDAETLRLHLGELTPDEVCVAKAAYRLALAAQENPNG